MRAINPKSSPFGCLVGDASGVGTNIGGGVAGGDCAGAKELLPGMPLDVAVGYGCEGAKGMLFAFEYAGKETSELFPADTGGVLCPSRDDGADDEPDWAIPAGGGVEVFTIGSAGEDGAGPRDRLGGLGMTYVGIYSASRG